MKLNSKLIGCSAIFLALFASSFLTGCGGLGGGISSNCTTFPYGTVSYWNPSLFNQNTLTDIVYGNSASASGVTSNSSLGYTALSLNPYGSSLRVASVPQLGSTSGLSVAALVKRTSISSLFGSTQKIVAQGQRQTPSIANVTGYQTTPTNAAYEGAVYDGRYVYFGAWNGIPAQYDTQQSFTSPQAWQYSATALDGGGSFAVRGVIYDGRYVYFVNSATTIFNRYDTQSGQSFGNTSGSGWSSIDLSTTTLGANGTGYIGGTFDGRYLYLPAYSGAGGKYIARYDTTTTQSFSTATTAWSKFNPTTLTQTGAANAWRYVGAGFDGRYVYFYNASYTVIARYDTTVTSDFSNSSSAWTLFDISTVPNENSSVFETGVFDGRYVTFIQSSFANLGQYDTQSAASFSSANAWNFISPSAFPNWNSSGGLGGVFDGQYYYFNGMALYQPVNSVPIASSTGNWNSFNLLQSFPSAASLRGGVFDGRYFYAGSSTTGYVTQYDTLGNQGMYELTSSSLMGDGKGTSVVGIGFRVNTNQGFYSANSSTLLDTNWHVLVGTYNGSTVSVYEDGNLLASQPAQGTMNLSNMPVSIGGFNGGVGSFGGLIGTVEVYNTGLSSSQVSTLTNSLALGSTPNYCH